MSEKFRAFMRRAGLANGRLHRFKAAGDSAGPPAAGAFGCWKRGIKETWHERNGALSQADWNKIRRRWKEADAERAETEQDRHTIARKLAARSLHQAKPVAAHAYLDRKGVKTSRDDGHAKKNTTALGGATVSQPSLHQHPGNLSLAPTHCGNPRSTARP